MNLSRLRPATGAEWRDTRQAAHRGLVNRIVADPDIDDIHRHLQQQHAFGSQRLRAAVEAQLGRRAGRRQSAGLRSGWIGAG